MRTIFIGPPGAGKGTQAYMLAAKFALPHVAPGRLIRESISVGSRLGMAANHHHEAGDPVPSNVMNALVADRISPIDGLRSGFILDGYPRSLEQAVRRGPLEIVRRGRRRPMWCIRRLRQRSPQADEQPLADPMTLRRHSGCDAESHLLFGHQTLSGPHLNRRDARPNLR